MLRQKSLLFFNLLKSKSPNTKLQTNLKARNPNTQMKFFRLFVFGIFDIAWSLARSGFISHPEAFRPKDLRTEILRGVYP